MSQGPVDPTPPAGANLPGGYDPTQVVTPVPGGRGGPGAPGGPRGPRGSRPVPGDGANRNPWIFGGLALLVVVLLGVLIGVLASGGGDDNQADDNPPSSSSTSSSSTSTSSTSSTSTSSTTSTTAAPGAPQINSFVATPNPFQCNGTSTQITLQWTTTNATGVTVSIDGPGPYANYGQNGSANVPYACPGPHTYTLTARNAANQTTQRTVTVPYLTPPASTVPSTTSTTKP